MAGNNKAKARTKVANGQNQFLENVDGRSLVARRFREVYGDMISDLGGDSQVSEGQRQLARRAATLSLQCEMLETEMATGARDLDIDTYAKLTNALNRILGSMGIKREAKPVQPQDDHAAAILDRDGS
jgi:hypothetical protein